MSTKKVDNKSVLLPLIGSSTPLVWMYTTEEYRMLEREQNVLLQLGVATQVYRYDAMDKLKEAHIPKKGAPPEGGREVEAEHHLDPINWFCKPFPDEDSPKAHTALTNTLLTADSFAPRNSVLVLFDVPSKLEHKNNSKWTDSKITRTIKAAIPSLIDEGKTIVIVSHTMDIPMELEHVAVLAEHPLPGYDDLSRLVRRAWNYLGDENQAGAISPMPPIPEETLEMVVALLSGMREAEADNILARSVYTNKSDRHKDPSVPKMFDVPTIRREKTLAIRKNSSLEIIEPPGSLDQVGGLEEVKEWAEEARGLFGKTAAAEGIKCPKGIVLFGPGGTGKTHTISCLGAFLNRTVLRWDVGASKDKFVGGTEGKTRQVFKDAKAQAPCILFVDEAGKLFADAKGQGAGLDGGVNQGMYASLLTFMQENDGGVLVAMACNEDIVNFPAPALRAGRIDRVFFVDLPGHDAIKDIIRIHIKRRGWDPDAPELNIEEIAKSLVDYTPSEIEQVINRGLIHKLKTYGPRPEPIRTENFTVAATQVTPMTKTNRSEVTGLREWAIERQYCKGPVQTVTPARKPAARRIGRALEESAVAEAS